MTVSLCHMLATIKLYQLLHTAETMTPQQEDSLKWKKRLFAVSIASTIGLILFFLKHRLLCHDMGKYFLNALSYPREGFHIGRW